jgi:hypothetical protein
MLPPCGLSQARDLFRYASCCVGGVLFDYLSASLFPLMSLFPETAVGEWRFHVVESVPVPVNGSDIEMQVMANPSGVCHASRLCLPLPYLRCQDTFSASSMVSPHVLCLWLPSPPWAYWDPASHEKLVA